MKIKIHHIERLISDYSDEDINLPDIDNEWKKFEKIYFKNKNVAGVRMKMRQRTIVILSVILILSGILLMYNSGKEIKKEANPFVGSPEKSTF